jgi:cytochrome P450
MSLADAAAPLIPPAPQPVFKRRSSLGLIRALRKDTLSLWGPLGYERMIIVGKVFGVFNVLVNEPDAVRRVLSEQAIYARPVSATRMLRPIIGRGLFLAEGGEWRRQRRALAPAFTPAHVEVLTAHFAEAARALAGRLQGVGRAQLVGALQETTLDAAARSLFSTPIGGRGARIAQLVRSYGAGPAKPNLLDVLVPREEDLNWLPPGRVLFKRRWAREIDAIVAGRRARPLPGDAPADMLELLFRARDPETGEPFSDAEIRDQASTMLVAGFETTGRSLFWTLYLLALDREEQARIREEVRADPPEGAVANVSRRWPRLRRAIMEALRLYPPAPLLVRRTVKPDTLLGIPIPRGAAVTVAPWIIHRHRLLWDNPSAFIPDRFEGKAQEWLTGGRYLPFGEGPRICIGASFAMTEAALVLAILLSRFEVAVDDERPLMPMAVVTTFPSIDPWFSLRPMG